LTAAGALAAVRIGAGLTGAPEVAAAAPAAGLGAADGLPDGATTAGLAAGFVAAGALVAGALLAATAGLVAAGPAVAGALVAALGCVLGAQATSVASAAAKATIGSDDRWILNVRGRLNRRCTIRLFSCRARGLPEASLALARRLRL
jgi:hypothetical protein